MGLKVRQATSLHTCQLGTFAVGIQNLGLHSGLECPTDLWSANRKPTTLPSASCSSERRHKTNATRKNPLRDPHVQKWASHKENQINGKYGISGGKSKTPKTGLGIEKIQMWKLHLRFPTKKNKGFHIPGPGRTCGTASPQVCWHLAGSRDGTPTENTETVTDYHWPEMVPDLTGGLDQGSGAVVGETRILLLALEPEEKHLLSSKTQWPTWRKLRQ